MKERNLWTVGLLIVVTLGIYYLVWMVLTKIEMNKMGAKIPTAWWIIVPFANIWWVWKWAEGVGHVTKKKEQLDGILAFVVIFALEYIGIFIIQHCFNEYAEHAPKSE